MTEDEFEFRESGEISFEQTLVTGARYEDLNAAQIEEFLRTRLSSVREADKRTPQEWLVSLGLVRAGDYAPTVAALVLFGEYPPRFMPQCALNAIRFRGLDLATNIILDRQMIEGTAAQMIEQAILFVKRNMRVGGVIGGIYRQDYPEYPEEAVREAVINAVIHRDYSASSKVLLKIFDDRLELDNPGGLPSGVTLETLLRTPRPLPRNPLIVRTLYEFWRGRGFIEEAGSGIPRIRRALHELGAGEPIFGADGLSFRVTLPARHL